MSRLGHDAGESGAVARAAHLLLGWSLAVAQPIYDLVGRFPELLVAQRTTPGRFWGLVALLSVGLPAVLVALAAVARRLHRGAGDGVQLALVGLFAALAAAPLLVRLPTAAALAAAGLVGVAVATAYRRWAAARTFATVLSLSVVVFPLVLATRMPASAVGPFGAAAAAGPPAEPAKSWGEVPVVVVVFDLLPTSALLDERGRIDAARYPSFARLAASSVWLRQAKTVARRTEQAVPSLLTGRRAKGSQVAIFDDHPDNLFTFLGARAPLRVFESVTWLCPPRLCPTAEDGAAAFGDLWRDLAVVYGHRVAPRGLARFLPSVDQAWGGFGRAAEAEVAGEASLEVRKEALRGRLLGHRGERREARGSRLDAFLAGLPERPAASLSYLHLDLPHGPFRYLPSGRRYRDPSDAEGRRHDAPLGVVDPQRGDQWADDPVPIAVSYRRLLLQIGYADRLLGQILDRLEELGSWKGALVVVAADHGQSYEAGQPLRDLHDADTAQVPLFFKLPGQRQGLIDDRDADLRDVLPTIAGALGLELPFAVEGRARIDARTRRWALRRKPPPGEPRPPEAWRRGGLRAALERKLERVGSGDDPALWSFGAGVAWLGRAVEPAADRPVATAVLDGAEALESIAAAGEVVPAYLEGRLTGAAAAPSDLVLELDGVVRSATRSFRDGDGVRFSFLVPERWLVPGRHRWAVHALDGPRLVELARGPS